MGNNKFYVSESLLCLSSDIEDKGQKSESDLHLRMKQPSPQLEFCESVYGGGVGGGGNLWLCMYVGVGGWVGRWVCGKLRVRVHGLACTRLGVTQLEIYHYSWWIGSKKCSIQINSYHL